MRWLSRGVVIRLFIYVPLIGFLAWRALNGRCGEPAPTMEAEQAGDDGLDDGLAPYRKTITLPDGTQQEIVELTPEQAEAVLGHPLPERMKGDHEAEAPPQGEAEAPPQGEADDGAEPPAP